MPCAHARYRRVESLRGVLPALDVAVASATVPGVLPSTLPYFAYGSNMLAEQMHDRCPGSTPRGLAHLDDHAFLINERGVATAVRDHGSVVRGVLWTVSEAHISALDGFEGLAIGNYTREVLPVIEAGDQTAVSIYLASQDTPSTPREGYLERVIAGAELFGISPLYIDQQLRVWAP